MFRKMKDIIGEYRRKRGLYTVKPTEFQAMVMQAEIDADKMNQMQADEQTLQKKVWFCWKCRMINDDKDWTPPRCKVCHRNCSIEYLETVRNNAALKCTVCGNVDCFKPVAIPYPDEFVKKERCPLCGDDWTVFTVDSERDCPECVAYIQELKDNRRTEDTMLCDDCSRPHSECTCAIDDDWRYPVDR